MNKAQREYTVLKISDYKDEVEEYDKKAERNRWFMYGCIGAIVLASATLEMENISEVANAIVSIIRFCGISFGLDSLKNMIENISKKAGLENKISDLYYQLNLDKLSDEYINRGRGL